MKVWSFLLIFMVSTVQAKRSDPFNHSNHSSSHENKSDIRVGIGLDCHSEKGIIAENISFSQLRLIGILIDKNNQQALFSDSEQNIFTVNQGELFAQEKLKLDSVTKKGVTFIQWKQSCDNPEMLNVKL